MANNPNTRCGFENLRSDTVPVLEFWIALRCASGRGDPLQIRRHRPSVPVQVREDRDSSGNRASLWYDPITTALLENCLVIPRGELDIDWRSLLWALGASIVPARSAADAEFDPERRVASCLSVRSGLDAVLSLTGWPAGSEVLMSAVNIPAMSTIISEHGLVPVPVDVSSSSLAPDVDQVRERITKRTRAMLVAHLFGSRLDLGRLHAVAQSAGIELWEDVAQGFHRDEHRQASLADVSFYSFGLIKTRTALGGGLVRFQSAERAERFRSLQSHSPVQQRSAFFRRVVRGVVLKVLGQHATYTVISTLATAFGLNLDQLLSNSLRGFKPGSLLSQLRVRPSAAQLKLLAHRILVQDQTMEWKATIVADYRRLLPPHVQVGLDADFPGHWVYPILSQQPGLLRDQLWRRGFDATIRGSQLRVVCPPASCPDWDTPVAARWVPQLLYLPMHRKLTNPHIQDIAFVVTEVEKESLELQMNSGTGSALIS